MIDGKPFSLDQFRGKLVLLDFWATWCPNCRPEAAHLRDISNRQAGSARLTIVGIDLDSSGDEARQFVSRYQESWPNVHTPGGWGDANPILRTYGVTAIPSYWLISSDGRVIARDIPPSRLDQVIADALKQ